LIALRVSSERHPEITSAAAAVAFASKKQPVSGRVESGREFGADAVESRNRHGCFPRSGSTRSMGDPEVRAPRAPGSIADEIQAEAIRRQRGVLLRESRIDRWSQVDRHRPG